MVTKGSVNGGNQPRVSQASAIDETLGRLAAEGRVRANQVQVQLDERREKLASALEEAALQLRARSEDGGPLAQAAGKQSARNLRRTAAYLHSHQSQEIFEDTGESIRKYPVPWIASTFVMGYLVGRLFR